MRSALHRRDFCKTCTLAGGLSLVPVMMNQCAHPSRVSSSTPRKYDIFAEIREPKHLVRFDVSDIQKCFPDADGRTIWIYRSILTIFQGLVNRREPQLFLEYERRHVDWLSIYQEQGYSFTSEFLDDYEQILRMFASEVDGYIIMDPEWIHTINVAQTWGSLENWIVITPDLEPLVQKAGLSKRQDLRGRWKDHVQAYEWAFENLFDRCSKHIVGNVSLNYPFHPSQDTTIRDFLVHNKAFTVDLSAALRQRREYRLLDRIYERLEFPSGIWGWHNTRDHEHYAVARAATHGAYVICALGCPNFSVHGGFRLKSPEPMKQKCSLRTNHEAEKNKIYIAFMMSDGDALWPMHSRQLGYWGADKNRDFPLSWGFLPLLIDIGPAMYRHFIEDMGSNDYMVAGPSGAGYTYPHIHPNPRKFLRYTKHYMQRCGLEMVHITNWNEYTNWQEVDLPEFNPMLFKELDNCIGYMRGMGESAFESHYNFGDRPYIFCGEGLHVPDKDDVATVRNFIEANPNRPLFIYCLSNISVGPERIKAVIDGLKEYAIDYVRLDDFVYLLKDAYRQGLITEDLYPNRKGNEQILVQEAPTNWAATKEVFDRLAPIVNADTMDAALDAINDKKARLALGQPIPREEMADVLTFALCESMFALVRDVLNCNGIHVNSKGESILNFLRLYDNWRDVDVTTDLFAQWNAWDEREIVWETVRLWGRKLLSVYAQADNLFSA